ncbi:hypothetical protein GH714_026289 [Hevea brasiliensis]|uniref:Reverse transcriptase Ty1/copia-type domain-containing protein n=1 Tax=Hevea brasiliensis TaxID=3981 RepID=A0A6A6M7Z8_HEVBR|nr:hypothetical protein GH714_026289 [Hevea brasiliensis]
MIADDLSSSGSPVNNEELVIKVLSSLGSDFKEFSAAICVRDTPITFAELYDKLLAHELFLQQIEPKKEVPIIIAQFNHNAKDNFSSDIEDNNKFSANFVTDDIVVTCNSISSVNFVIKRLSQRFSVKDLGMLHYFLGVEVTPISNGLMLTQHKFISNLLERFSMLGAKGVSTPMSLTESLSLNDGVPLTNIKEYQQIVALQYLQLTRLDLSFTINKLAQLMHRPSINHFKAAKRVLRYLKDTITHGLLIIPNQDHSLRVYSNADWVGNLDDKTSTSAYLVFHGKNAIS